MMISRRPRIPSAVDMIELERLFGVYVRYLYATSHSDVFEDVMSSGCLGP